MTPVTDLGFWVMLCIASAESGEEYGWSIAKWLDKKGQPRKRVTSIYRVANSLEAKDFLTSRLGEPDDRVGGERRKYYKLTDAGRRVFEQLARSRKSVARKEEELVTEAEHRLADEGR